MQQPIGRESQLYFRFQAFRNLLSSSNWSKNVDSTLLSGKVLSFKVFFLSICQRKQLTSFYIDIVDPSFYVCTTFSSSCLYMELCFRWQELPKYQKREKKPKLYASYAIRFQTNFEFYKIIKHPIIKLLN